MAKPSHRKLKVYQAQIGFHDSVVAASSQAAALRAWGTRQNLFAEGQAKVATDPAALAAALAHPDVPLRRPVGSHDPFSLDPAAPKVPTKGRPAKAKPEPDRGKLDAAEAALAKVETEREREAADLRARREALDAEEARASQAWDERRQAAQQAIDRARRAFREAGGKA